MEAWAQICEVLSDKTGTLIKGTLGIIDIVATVCGLAKVLEMILQAEAGIAHLQFPVGMQA